MSNSAETKMKGGEKDAMDEEVDLDNLLDGTLRGGERVAVGG
jgi:hypothetical protein